MPEVDQIAPDQILQITYLHDLGIGPADHGEKTLSSTVQKPVGMSHDLRLQDPQIPEEPTGDPDAQTADVQFNVIPGIEGLDDVPEILLDGLSLKRTFGGKFTALPLEVPVQAKFTTRSYGANPWLAVETIC